MAWRQSSPYHNAMRSAIDERTRPKTRGWQRPTPSGVTPTGKVLPDVNPPQPTQPDQKFWGVGPDPELWNTLERTVQPTATPTTQGQFDSPADYRRHTPGISVNSDLWRAGFSPWDQWWMPNQGQGGGQGMGPLFEILQRLLGQQQAPATRQTERPFYAAGMR